MSASSLIDDGVCLLSLIFELHFLGRDCRFYRCIRSRNDDRSFCGVAWCFHLNKIAKAIVIVDVETARGRNLECVDLVKNSAGTDSNALVKNCRQGHHELMVLDSTLAKALFIIPRVTHFYLFSTRVTEFLQLQLDSRFDIQIYDRTQNSESLLKVPFQIYNLQCSGSEAAQNRF
jgi:hypothetical protein